MTWTIEDHIAGIVRQIKGQVDEVSRLADELPPAPTADRAPLPTLLLEAEWLVKRLHVLQGCCAARKMLRK